VSRYRTAVDHLEQLGELKEIIASMKTLSQLELHKLAGVSESQHAMAERLQAMAEDFYHHYPQPSEGEEALWLVVGSERGFCGDFNEAVMQALFDEFPQCREQPQRVIGVGQKLWLRLEDALPGFMPLEGASVSEELSRALGTVVAGIEQRISSEGTSVLRVLYHDDQSGRIESYQLLPPVVSEQGGRLRNPPLLQLEPKQFLEQFLQQYLYLGLNELFVISLLAENQFRVQHLDGAVRRLDERLEDLGRRARSLRQEEITEEIETILLGAEVGGVGFPENH